MPAAGNKGDYRVLLTFYNDKIKRVTIARTVNVRCTAALFCKYFPQGIQLDICDRFAGIELISPDAGADECRPGHRQRKIEGFEAVFPGNDNVRVFYAGIEHAVDKARRSRVGRQDIGYLALEKEFVTRLIGRKRQGAMESVGNFVR